MVATDFSMDIVRQSTDLWQSFRHTIVEIQRFAQMTVRAMHSMMSSVPLIEALASLDRWERDQDQTGSEPERGRNKDDDVARAKADAAYIQKHRDNGYSAVYSQQVIATWGALEAHVDDVVVMLLRCDKRFLATDALKKTKIPLAAYEALNPSERIEFLLDSLQRDLNARFKKGLGQFESVFDAIDFPGTVEDDLRRTFIEFAAVRNVLVHKRGIADKRLIDACPWLQLPPGVALRISVPHATRYWAAAAVYASKIHRRVIARYAPNSGEQQDVDRLIETVMKIGASIGAEPLQMPVTPQLSSASDVV